MIKVKKLTSRFQKKILSSKRKDLIVFIKTDYASKSTLVLSAISL